MQHVVLARFVELCGVARFFGGVAMKVAIASLVSQSPYSQGRPVVAEKSRDETYEDFEKRTWRERAHVNSAGYVYIPPTMFKNSIAEAAKYKSIQIPGKGKSTYTKHFEAGILCKEPLELPIKADDLIGENVFAGMGPGKRVWKTFPLIPEWSGDVEFLILDETITKEIFEQHLIDAGSFIGIGRWRPRNNGQYGRFRVKSISWK